MDEPIFTYSRPGFTFTVIGNRIDIVEKSGCLGFLSGGKRQSFVGRNIASVTVEGMTRKLKITTNDGKASLFNLGAQAEQARQAVLQIM